MLSTGFGLESHLGVLADIPCVGVAKKLYHVDGIRKGPEHKEKVLTTELSTLSFSLSQFTTSLSVLSCRVFIENVIACHCLPERCSHCHVESSLT